MKSVALSIVGMLFFSLITPPTSSAEEDLLPEKPAQENSLIFDDFNDGVLGTNLGGEAGPMSPVADFMAQLQMINIIFDTPPNAGTVYVDFVRFTNPTSLVLDDFNDGSHPNNLGGSSGIMPDPSWISDTYVDATGAYEGDGALKLEYDFPSGEWAGYWSFMRSDQGAYDASAYRELKMWVRGAVGGERFRAELKDIEGNVRSVPVTLVPGFEAGLTTEWRELVIPLDMFGGIRNPTIEFTSDAREGPYALRISYNPRTWCGYYNFMSADRGAYNASAYGELRMWVKGASGGERFWIKLEDVENNILEVPITLLPGFEDGVTTTWQELRMPIKHFVGVDVSKLRMVNLIFKNSGTVYIDFIRFLEDTTSPTSSVNPIVPYWQVEAPFTVTANASDDLSGVASVELWYSYSHDNTVWELWNNFGIDTNGADGWSWGFTAPEGYGYYEFYSIAVDRAGNREESPIEADALCRFARQVLDVAVVLARPNDVENFRPIEEMITTARVIPQYFDEVSYGALAIAPLELITDDGGWFRLSHGWRHYGTKEWWQFWLYDRSKEFGEEAISVAGIQRGIYDIIIVVFAGPSEQWPENMPPYYENFSPKGDRMLEAYWGGSEATPHLITVSEFSNPVYARENLKKAEDLTWAHEIGHALDLPDLYPTSGSWGNANNWDLMGTRDMVHFCSWSKERLEWLEYEDIGVGWSDWIEVLPRLSYGGKAYRYWFESNEFFLLEVRNPSQNYSIHDKWIPGAGLVNYDVWYQEPSWWPGPDVNVEAHGLVDMIIDIPEAVVIKIVDRYEGTDTFKLKISVEEFGVKNMKGAVWRPVTFPSLLKSPSPSPPVFPTDNSIIDYDLHAYTPDGKHVGMNYLTNTYEVEIPGAVSFGDRLNREWIFVPENVEVYFTVSSRDVASFLENHPSALENENAVYELRVVHFDENGVRYRSDVMKQEIPPGAEIVHPFTITQNPDGTYSIEVKQGMDFLSLDAWHAAIDNIPNKLFISPWRRPSRLDNKWVELRKQALKLKFNTVFRILEENRFESILERLNVDNRARPWIEYIRYKLAIWKLEHDILEKLDADGRADWTYEAVLVDELEAFIGYLKDKAPPGPSPWVERYIDREAERLLRWFEVD